MSGSKKNKLCGEAKHLQVQMAYRDCLPYCSRGKQIIYFERASSQSFKKVFLEIVLWNNDAEDERVVGKSFK
jgi:hypothetical protein